MPASRSASAMTAGAGRRFGAPSSARTTAPPAKPAETASRSGTTPPVAAIAITTTRHAIATSLGSPPRPREPWLAHHRRARRARHVRERGEPRRRHPRRRAHRILEPSREVEVEVEKREDDRAGGRPQHDETDATPSALPDEQADDHRGHEQRADLDERERELADGIGDRRRRAPDVGRETRAGRLRESEEQHEQDRGDSPHDETNDVTRMPEVAVTRRTSGSRARRP